MDILEGASRFLMSVLQTGHSNKPAQYASRTSQQTAQNVTPSSSGNSFSFSDMSMKGFPSWASSTTGLPISALALISMLILYPITKAVYNIWFHPLSKFPGPALAVATKIPIAMVSWDGGLSNWLKELHDYYRSDVVRISPDELSFIGASAWKDLYGNRPGHQNFQKDLLLFTGVDYNIVVANDADHSRMRRLLSHAFSDKALREQEPLLQGYVHNLISGLQKQIDSPTNGKVNLADWFNWTTFDMIGDLSFGDSFNCLKSTDYHPWVANILDSLKLIVFHSVTLRFPPLERLLRLYVPKSAIEARAKVVGLAKEKVERRINTNTTRPDFMSYILKHNEGKEKGGMTREEIHNNAGALIVAGSETTASHLAGSIWFLLKNPHCMENILEEIRAFRKAEDLNIQNIIQLPYFQAVVDEVFRMYPPAIVGQPRIVPKGGDTVSGHFVPGGYSVQLNQYAANHSLLNFNSPDIFAPSRWLGNEHFTKDKREVVQPFNIGARNCIGKNLALAEIRLTLAHILWHFDIELDEATDEDWAFQKGWFTWAKKPLIVKLKARRV